PGPAARAEELVARLTALADGAAARNAPASSETRAALLTGLAEQSRIGGRPDPARWTAAVEVWEAIGFPCCAAYAHYRGGEAALGAGDDEGAERELRGAWPGVREPRRPPPGRGGG